MDLGVLLLTIVCLVLAYLYGKKDNATVDEVKIAVATAIKQAGIAPGTGNAASFPPTLSRATSGLTTPSSSSLSSGSDSHLEEYVKTLEAQNRDLQKQLTLAEVSNVVEVDQKYGNRLKPGDIETIRAIFALFDTNNQGWIRSSDLISLHTKLGEPLTDAEAQQAINELDPEGKGAVTFNKFLYWWYDNHKNNKKGSQYTARFKLLSSKLQEGSFDADRVITQESGTPFTLEYRLNFYYKNANQSLKQISVWHDVPLYRMGFSDQHSGQIYNFVCEIPKWTRAKFEIATGEPYNPIKQDTKNGQLRFYKHGDMMFNYGCFPQTWEDPNHRHEDTQMPGDNDPIDCLEIGCRQIKTGAIVAVKILGVLAMIDDGETDWKVIAIAINDPMAYQINDIDDVETHLPGAIHAIREYLRDYKNYAGGSQNRFALREQAMPRDYATKIVEETHKSWQMLHNRGSTTVSKAH